MRIFKKLFRRIITFHHYKNRENKSKKQLVFGNSPIDFTIEEPYWITNPENIIIGDSVGLGHGSILKAQKLYPRGWMKHPDGDHIEQSFQSRIIIGNRVTATASLQVIAFREIVIEDDVMFASNVFICDGLHGYDRADKPYKYQGITGIASIKIKKGSWIGQNVVILPGVEVGEFCIIGANSVVNRSIPSKSIATGSPAKVIKKWNQDSQSWVSAKM